MAHALVVEGDREQGIRAVRAYAADALALAGENNPDVTVFQYGLFSVEDARAVAQFASSSPVQGDRKLVAIVATRIFHEAQNALLKLFEEPPVGVTMVLVVPSLGQLLPTLRSRVQTLSGLHGGPTRSNMRTARDFLILDSAGREKFLSKLLERTKGDKDEDKQHARGELLRLVEDLIRVTYEERSRALPADEKELTLFLADLSTFLPILHERSAPLKLLCEHLLLVMPQSLSK